ncbi:glycosyltransferase [Gracilinema caldarium]|uniref:glycosyltransferase n=1 Tax=Gracilinema caldarium TaxID=215591 RepID=UPI0026EF03BF|nr:glycosyltransferase [Gracilinema caldarium]
MKTNLVVTASDRKYGDFLIEHWYASLRDTSNLNLFDVAVLDYGLSVAQRFYLQSNGVLVRSCKRDGHVTSIRYRDLQYLLQEHPVYEQVMLCDSGDIIFQGDISPLFEVEKDQFRAVCEDYKPLVSIFISSDFFDPDDKERLLSCFIKNPMINGGMVLAPREKMLALSEEMLKTIKDMSRFGPDQVVLNGFLYDKGYYRLDSIYNYVIATAKEGIEIKHGVFYTGAGRRIVVVHNAGNVGALRPIEHFGYGPKHNILKDDVYRTLKAFYESTEGLFKTQELFLDSQRRFKAAVHKFLKDIGIKTR